MTIRNKRIEIGLSQAELAERIGVTQSTISFWESGRYEPSLSDLRKLSQVLSCAIVDLIDEPEQAGEVS